MNIFKALTGAVFALGLSMGAVQATPVSFGVGAGTGVSDLSGCIGCSVDIDLAAGLIGTAFDLEEGESQTLEFFDISANLDNPFFAAGGFLVSAALELDPPGGTSSSLGGGAFANLGGFVTLGALVWVQDTFTFGFGDGGQYSVVFDQGVDLILGTAVTINATVTLDTAPAPVPLPAGAVLLLTGLGGLGAMRLRRRQSAAA